MSDDYTIHYEDLASRLHQQGDVNAFGKQHGVERIEDTFKVMQDIPPNPGQENLRKALRALGYDFDDDQAVIISYDDYSPLVEDA